MLVYVEMNIAQINVKVLFFFMLAIALARKC